MIPLSTFLSSAVSIYPSSASLSSLLASYLVIGPLKWTFDQLGITGEDGIISSHPQKRIAWHGTYVMTALLEEAGDRILDKQTELLESRADTLYTFESFRYAFADCLPQCVADNEEAKMTGVDAKILIKYLERDKSAVIVQDDVGD
jgi:charged multivesicular body protein 7